jgi:hypothetical protein
LYTINKIIISIIDIAWIIYRYNTCGCSVQLKSTGVPIVFGIAGQDLPLLELENTIVAVSHIQNIITCAFKALLTVVKILGCQKLN